MMKEGDLILAAFRAGDTRAEALVRLRLADGATEADIRNWYNMSPRKRTKVLNTDLVTAAIFLAAKKTWGDEDLAISYAHARVPLLGDTFVDGPPPDESDPDRQLFCCLQPRVDRWLSHMRLHPCTNDELDQRMESEGHKTVNSVIRADMARGRF